MGNTGFNYALKGKCPCCRKGDLFTTSTYSLDFYKTNTYCPSCNVTFEVEPGFFIGAMYINYAFTVSQVLVIGFLVHFLIIDSTIFDFMLATAVSISVLLPITFRLSKSLYLYWFSGLKFEGNTQTLK